MQCPKCHNEVEKGQNFCTHCGYELKKKKIDRRLIFLICAVVAIFLIKNFGMYALENHINLGSRTNEKFIEALKAEDYKTALKLTNLDESEFINSEELKRFLEEENFDYNYIEKNSGFKIDFGPFVTHLEIELPKGSKLWVDGKEIKDSKEFSSTNNLLFEVGEVFVCNHRVKITSPLAETYDEDFKPSHADDGSAFGSSHIKPNYFLNANAQNTKEIESASQIAISEVLQSDLKTDFKESYYEINYKDELKNELSKGRITKLHISDVSFGVAKIINSDTATDTAFVTIESEDSVKDVLVFNIECKIQDGKWDVSAIEFLPQN